MDQQKAKDVVLNLRQSLGDLELFLNQSIADYAERSILFYSLPLKVFFRWKDNGYVEGRDMEIIEDWMNSVNRLGLCEQSDYYSKDR